MDNTDATVSGTWSTVTSLSAQPSGGYNILQFSANYHAAYFSSGNTAERSMTYTPANLELGLYDVYLWSPLYNGYYTYNSPATKLTIHTAVANWGVADVTRTINQQTNSGMWAHAGRYVLYASGDPDTAKRPWLKISTPQNPYDPSNTYYYNQWFTSNQGYFLADGVMIVRDNEEVDSDEDGLPDWKEQVVGTNHLFWDTDDDDIGDGDEVRLGLDPLGAITTTTNPAFVQYTVFTPLTPP